MLDAVLPDVEKTSYDLAHGASTPPARCCRTPCSTSCARTMILLGAIGDPSVPSGVLERGLLLGSGSSWTTTSICDRPGSIPG